MISPRKVVVVGGACGPMSAAAAGAPDGGLVLVLTLALTVARVRAPSAGGRGGDGAPATVVRVVVPGVGGDVPAAECAIVGGVPAHISLDGLVVRWEKGVVVGDCLCVCRCASECCL